MIKHPNLVSGEYLKLGFPPTIEAFRLAGADFLTRAFRASGILAHDNHVSAITSAEEFQGGGMGRKLRLDVEYASDQPHLTRCLFVKFTPHFDDRFRDRFAPAMRSEILFSLLTREREFPVTIPQCYFADYDRVTASGILITERVQYGLDAIEPFYDKCFDYRLSDPLPYYESLTENLGKLAGSHKAGKLGNVFEEHFSAHLDAGASSLAVSLAPEQMREKIGLLRDFANRAPGLFEEGLLDQGLYVDLDDGMMIISEHRKLIQTYLDNDQDYIAFCHWNLNIDNAWFFKEGSKLNAGLLDWGNVGQLNLARAFYGMICATETDFLVQHREHLVQRFCDQYHEHGGPRLSPDRFLFMLQLTIAVYVIPWLLDVPALIQRDVVGFETIRDRHDVRLQKQFLARVQHQCLMVALSEWKSSNIAGALRDFAEGRRE